MNNQQGEFPDLGSQASRGEYDDFFDDNGNEIKPTISSGRKQRAELQRNEKRIQCRVHWDLFPEVRRFVKNLASKEKISESQIGALFVLVGLLAYLDEEVSLNGLRRPCASPRFDWNLSLEMLLDEVCKKMDGFE